MTAKVSGKRQNLTLGRH